MNGLAKQLIDDMRHNKYVRAHFNMLYYHGRNRCNTVGCIAGTAIYMSNTKIGIDKAGIARLSMILAAHGTSAIEDGELVYAQKLLGINHTKTAIDLFMPWEQMKALQPSTKYFPRGRVPRPADHFDYLSHNERPDLDTVRKMIQWARLRENVSIDPSVDQAALALERVVRDEIPYCNWAEAYDSEPGHSASSRLTARIATAVYMDDNCLT